MIDTHRSRSPITDHSCFQCVYKLVTKDFLSTMHLLQHRLLIWTETSPTAGLTFRLSCQEKPSCRRANLYCRLLWSYGAYPWFSSLGSWRKSPRTGEIPPYPISSLLPITFWPSRLENKYMPLGGIAFCSVYNVFPHLKTFTNAKFITLLPVRNYCKVQVIFPILTEIRKEEQGQLLRQTQTRQRLVVLTKSVSFKAESMK